MSPAALDFRYAAPEIRVLLGAGRSRLLKEELNLLGVRRPFVVCTASGERRYIDVIAQLVGETVAIFAKAEAHCPEPVALAALAAFDATQADGVVTIGGGSTIGLGKYIAAKRHVPLLSIPTTLSGSEMTPLYGVKIGTEKRTTRDAAARPRTVIYDPNLTETLPKHETATTGMNCMAHCVEALYPAEPNPVARLLALEGIRQLATGLPDVIARNDESARAAVLYAGFLGGHLVATVGIGLHHALCHVLGGHFDIAHGDSNSVILPHVVAFNAPYMPGVAADIAAALNTDNAATGLRALVQRVGAPLSLRDLGVSTEQLGAVAAETAAKSLHNPRPITAEALLELLQGAWEGRLPADHNQKRHLGNVIQGGHHVKSATP